MHHVPIFKTKKFALVLPGIAIFVLLAALAAIVGANFGIDIAWPLFRK